MNAATWIGWFVVASVVAVGAGLYSGYISTPEGWDTHITIPPAEPSPSSH